MLSRECLCLLVVQSGEDLRDGGVVWEFGVAGQLALNDSEPGERNGVAVRLSLLDLPLEFGS